MWLRCGKTQPLGVSHVAGFRTGPVWIVSTWECGHDEGNMTQAKSLGATEIMGVERYQIKGLGEPPIPDLFDSI